jgi:hypothetical protein
MAVFGIDGSLQYNNGYFFLRTNDGYFYWTVKQCARSALLVSVVLFISRCILGLLDATLILV